MDKILIVDDERKITQIYKNLLTEEGYTALEANDGHSATHLLISEGDVNLILLDIRMPHVDGVALYEVAKQFNPDIKIIITSVYSPDHQRELIRADAYFSKLQGFEILLSKIREVLESASCRKS